MSHNNRSEAARNLARSKAMREGKALIQALLDLHTEDAVCVLDREKRHVAVNSAWKITLGLDDSVIGKTPEEAFGSSNQRFNDDFDHALNGQEMIRTFQLPSSKEIVQVSLSPWRGPKGVVLGVISRHTLGERPRAAQIARERRMKMALDMAGVTAFEIDFRSGVMEFEPRGHGRIEQGVHCYDDLLRMLPESEHEVFREKWNNHLRTGTPVEAEFQIFDDGGLSWWRTTAEAVNSIDGHLVGMIGVAQNVDRQKSLEWALIEEKEAAQAADHSKSEFLANISHEIRTPLNGVLGLASHLRRTQLDTTQHEMVRTIEASAQTLNALLSDVLDLAKIESGRLELDPQPFNPEDVVRHLHRLFRGAAGDKGLDFRCEIEDSVAGLALADSTRVNQILTNLISNAIKFTAAGMVELRAWAEGADDRQRLCFSVTDTGAGISKDALPRLFERFVQADGSISRSYGGTGLGLAISRNLAQMMGGDVSVSSNLGQGSRFTLSIDAPRLGDGTAETVDNTVAMAELPERRLRVLLVEDHPVNRRVVELILADVADLECAENGARGVDAFCTQAFDVVLMDMQMPVMDGLEATRAIRTHECTSKAARTPIVMLSANALPEHVSAGQEAGADFHLAKPITADDLLNALARALQLYPDPNEIAQAS